MHKALWERGGGQGKPLLVRSACSRGAFCCSGAGRADTGAERIVAAQGERSSREQAFYCVPAHHTKGTPESLGDAAGPGPRRGAVGHEWHGFIHAAVVPGEAAAGAEL